MVDSHREKGREGFSMGQCTELIAPHSVIRYSREAYEKRKKEPMRRLEAGWRKRLPGGDVRHVLENLCGKWGNGLFLRRRKKKKRNLGPKRPRVERRDLTSKV